MTCERCEMRPATHEVKSDVMLMRVCDDCAQQAYYLMPMMGREGKITIRLISANGQDNKWLRRFF